MRIFEIMSDLENMNPDIFKDTYLIRKMPGRDERHFYPAGLIVRYLPHGPTIKVGYAGKDAAPWMVAVIIDIIDGV